MTAFRPARGLSAAWLAIGLGLVAPAQMIPNPSFELPGYGTAPPTFQLAATGSNAISGWTIGGPTGVDYFRVGSAADGEFMVDLVRGPGEGGVISTTITGLIPGSSYAVEFQFQTPTLAAGTRVTMTIDAVSMDFDATLANTWQTHAMDFIAGSTSAALSLAAPASGALDDGVFVDNLSITAIPEPGAYAALLAAVCFSVGLCRRRSRGIEAAHGATRVTKSVLGSW